MVASLQPEPSKDLTDYGLANSSSSVWGWSCKMSHCSMQPEDVKWARKWCCGTWAFHIELNVLWWITSYPLPFYIQVTAQFNILNLGVKSWFWQPLDTFSIHPIECRNFNPFWCPMFGDQKWLKLKELGNGHNRRVRWEIKNNPNVN